MSDININFLIKNFMDNIKKVNHDSIIKDKFFDCLLNSIKSSEKFMIGGEYHKYIKEDYKYIYDYSSTYSFEFRDESLKRDVIVNIIGSKNNFYDKMCKILGVKSTQKNGYLYIYLYKELENWSVSSKFCFLDENDNSIDYNVSIFKKPDENLDIQNKIFLNYKNLIKLSSHSDIEYYIINSNDFYYKIPHLFLL